LLHYAVIVFVNTEQEEIFAGPFCVRLKCHGLYHLHVSESFFGGETNICWCSTDVPRILWNPKAHCLVHRNPLFVAILSQISLPHTLIDYFPNIHFNIILPPTPRSSKKTLSFKCSHTLHHYEDMFATCVLARYTINMICLPLLFQHCTPLTIYLPLVF
jgi:hypothetical protein